MIELESISNYLNIEPNCWHIFNPSFNKQWILGEHNWSVNLKMIVLFLLLWILQEMFTISADLIISNNTAHGIWVAN